jgi:2-C-methyl-D-erythritol 4-phosphate cytidylyltransferase/2-C-methyl-D-erythritol 4-phosphate cytidylyltransferase/2-C-methyl-D-erythritol 2,4-cyclodiphosphate synthase
MTHAIILAAGRSSRMNGVNKIIALLAGKPVLAHVIEKFQQCEDVDSVIVVTQKDLFNEVELIKKNNHFTKIKNLVEGGRERQDSVFNGFSSLKNMEEEDIVVVHNGSNAFVSVDEINECVSEAKKHGAAVCAFPLKDTIKKVGNGFVKQTLSRENVWQMQTPQCVHYGIFRRAMENAKKQKKYYTDDVALVEAIGKKVKIVQCSSKNFKITTPDDLEMAEKLLGGATKVGIGQDHHRFVEGRKKPLVIGGYIVPNEIGLEAKSDGDIVLHALFNAISSAMGGRSLSITADSMLGKGITDSSQYLLPLLKEMKNNGWAIGNISCSIEAKHPKLEPHHDRIKESICRILGIEEHQIGLTFTSGEGLTGMGRGEGMGCVCIVALTK